jgi:hypothetical protein
MTKLTSKATINAAGKAAPEGNVANVNETLETVAGAVSEYGAGEVYNVPVAIIWYETDKAAVDYDPRVERTLPDTFVETIEREGVLESITLRESVNPANPKQTLKVVNGKTRFRAALKAGLALIKGGIVTADAKKALELQVLLNAHRFADESDLQCDNAARLAALGYSVAEIARVFNVPESTARNTLKIVKTVPEVAASPHLSFAAKEELSRRDPETVAAALPILEDVAKAAELSKDGKADAGLAKGKDGKASRKADATVKETKDGRKVGQASHSATKGLCDVIEGKDKEPAKPAKPAAPAKAPAVAAKDTRPDAGSLRAKAALCRAVSGLAKGTGAAAESHRAFVAGVQAALFFAAGDKLDTLPGGPITPEVKAAVADALARLFKDATLAEDKAAA